MSTLGDLFRRATARPITPPGQLLLRGVRRRVLERVQRACQPRVEALRPALDAGREEARAELGRIADEALREFRSEARREAEASPLLCPWVCLDTWWRATSEPEYMDDPKLDVRKRTAILETLDSFNRLLGSYEHWFEALRRFLRPDRPTTVLDLASGHGGFALAIARLARKAGLPVKMVASDIRREYMEIGGAIAAREGLDVRFREQDALNLRSLEEDPPDLVTCTQALHHFPPGWVSRMFDEAARVARRGVFFVDGCRTMMHVPLLTVWGYGVCRVPDFSHDAVVSLRRFFSIEELDLLAKIVPRPWPTEARLVGPCHVALVLAK